MPTRFSRISLAEPPETALIGAYSEGEATMEWFQARDRFHAMLFFHDGFFLLNGSAIPFRQGAFFVIPPGSRCKIEPRGPGPHVHGFFSFHPPHSGKDIFLIPVVTQFSKSESDVWEQVLRLTLGRLSMTRTSVFATAWGLLWRVAQPMNILDANPLIDAATTYVRDHLAEKISIRDMAGALDISHNQLIRRFRMELGLTPIQYVRQQRAEAARTLLTTTPRPIKSIAHEVGVPDLHAFNRLIRECLGMSPRQLRRARRELDYYRTADYESEP